jgi:hypothetical protein
MQQRTSEPSLGELFAELTHEMTTLVRQEVALATTELGHKVSQVGRDLGFLALGGAVAYAGVLALVAAAILLLALVIPIWLSALVVGLVVAGVGYLLVRRGLDALRRTDLAPRQTLQTLKEDAAWAKEQTR